jgi:hypothetical protein
MSSPNYTGSTVWIRLSITGKDAGGGNRDPETLPGILWKEPSRTSRNHIILGIRTRHLPHARQLSQQGKLSRCSIRYRAVGVKGSVHSAFTVS